MSRVRIGPIVLAPGVSSREIVTFLFVAISGICVVQFTALIQPFIFSEQLHAGADEQGRLAGALQMMQQIAVLIFLTPAGYLADRIGRRNLLVLALVGYGLCMAAFPLVATVAALFLVRFVFGISYAGHTASAATMLVADYPAEESRGKFIAVMLALQNLAVAIFVGFVGARMPTWLIDRGFTVEVAGTSSFWMMGLLVLIGALACYSGLKRDRGRPAPDAPPVSMWVNAKQIYTHARTNPRFAFIMLVGFVIRTDYAIIGAFLSLWVVRAGADAGIETATALKTAGLLLSVLSVASFVTPPLFGFIADRVNRTSFLIVCLGLTALAFSATALITDVFGWGMYAEVCFIGLAESAQIVASQSVFGEQVPAHLRGSAMGWFSAIGSISVLIVSFVGGIAFDKVGYTGPFVITAGLHALFCIAALVFVTRGGLTRRASAASR